MEVALNATYLQTGASLGASLKAGLGASLRAGAGASLRAGAGYLPAIILSISLPAIMRQRVLAWGMGW